MACGVEANTYQTLDSAVLVLPSGTVVDTGAPDADAMLQRAEEGVVGRDCRALGNQAGVGVQRLHGLRRGRACARHEERQRRQNSRDPRQQSAHLRTSRLPIGRTPATG